MYLLVQRVYISVSVQFVHHSVPVTVVGTIITYVYVNPKQKKNNNNIHYTS